MTGLFFWKRSLFLLLLFVLGLSAADYDDVYGQISDICNPSKADWKKLQQYINKGERPYLKWLDTFDSGLQNDGFRYDLRARNFNFIRDKKLVTDFCLHQESIGVGEQDRENCIICYASFNSNFAKKIKRLSKRLKESGYKGHFLYRIGGFPDIKGGSLKLIHVPYSFKVCLFREAQKLGFKKVFWMDTSFKPLKNFDALFEMIKKNGYFISSLNGYSLRMRASKKVKDAFSLSDEEMLSIREIASGLIGVDFSQQTGRDIIDKWYKAAEDLDPYLSPRPEQSAIAAIIYKMGLQPTCSFLEITAVDKKGVDPKHYFYLDY